MLETFKKLRFSAFLYATSVIVGNGALIWTMIEFILYLAKDTSFNWWSLWTFTFSVLVGAASFAKIIHDGIKGR